MLPRRWTRAVPVLVLLPALVTAACPFAAISAAFGGAGALEPAADLERAAAARVLLQASKPKDMRTLMAAIASLDVAAVKADLAKLMTDSQAFWPADFGHYGGLFIRLAWHCNGSYRQWDGRGGCDGARIRFTPELAWPDNTNLDKARRLLAPIKAKYGDALTWGDLIVLAGDVAIESMGGPKMGVCLGRIDDYDGTKSLELGPTAEQRLVAPCVEGDGMCEGKLGQTTMGLIYVNPEGVLEEPVPEKSVPQIRGTFGRMGMNDSETVALIGGGHAFGKAHGACKAGAGPGPDKDPSNPWPGLCGSGAAKGKGDNAFTSGLEGAWTTNPTQWDNEYFKNLLKFDWVKDTSPGGKHQWAPRHKDPAKAGSQEGLPDIMMFTTDLALLKDPKYLELVKTYSKDLNLLTKDFGAAWYKLMTRDMGPVTRCLNKATPPPLPWQLPLPKAPAALADMAAVKADVLKALGHEKAALAPADAHHGKPTYTAQLAALAYQCAGTYRATDYAGGCNGARIRFSPLKDWPVNAGLGGVLKVLEPIKQKYGPGVSWADLIVLAGTAAAEHAAGPAAAAAGAAFPFCPGRADAAGPAQLEYLAPRSYSTPLIAFKDNAKVAGLSLEEAVALAARPRSPELMHAQGYSGGWAGASPAELSNEYFTLLLTSQWDREKSKGGKDEFKARGKAGVYMLPEDIAIKEDAQLSALARAYSNDNAKFLRVFAAAWTKVMNADRFDGPAGNVCDRAAGAPVKASV